jgi:molybdopterin-guanine dinucleotide biosynthesis protein A
MSATLAILAGGAGSRMGRPKAELLIDGRPILQYLLDQTRWPGPTLLVTAPGREHPPGWDRFDAEAIDPVAGLGPLRGVLTGLEAAKSDIVIFTTVDMPGMGGDQLAFVGSQLESKPDAIGIMLKRAEIEPLPCALRRSCIPMIERRLAEQRRSVWGLSQETGMLTVAAASSWDESVWTNLNAPDDIARFVPRASRP